MSCDFTITLLLNIHSAGPSLGHFVSELVLHWVQGRCIALRNVRTLGDFSATVVLRHYCHGRTVPTASGTLQLEKSVISCSTAPQLHRSTAPDFFPTPKPRLLCSLLNSKPSTPPTSIEVLSILSVLHFAQNSWNLAPLSYLHFWTWLVQLSLDCGKRSEYLN